MASKKQWKNRMQTSERVYQVFKQIATSAEGSYSTEIQRQLDSGAVEDITRLLTVLKEEKLIKKGKRTKAQYYQLNDSGLSKKVCELTEYDGELPDTFVENYVRYYCSLNRESTIRDMLRDDFVSIFSAYSEYNDVPGFLESFLDRPEVLKYDSRFMDIAEDSLEDL